ncbi:MAG TPA: transposase [Kofleriaceae bacterium]
MHRRGSIDDDRLLVAPPSRMSDRNAIAESMAGMFSTTKSKRGGKRPNAGRKRSEAFKYDPSHAKRPALFFKHPVHIMLRTLASVPRLRQRDGYEAIRTALLHFVEGATFRVVHISIQRNHLHLIVEAANKEALRRGMQSFSIRAARALNENFGREGKVFAFRYQAKQIKTPDYARNALSYVLNNWRRHRQDERAGEQSMPFDRFSSAWAFVGWSASNPYEPPDCGLPVSPPRTPLLTSEWEWYGLIDPFEVPGPLE